MMRGQAMSGFELESNLNSLRFATEMNNDAIDGLLAHRDMRSSAAGKNDLDDPESYVALSEYEVDPEDIKQLNEQVSGIEEDAKEQQVAAMVNDLQRFKSSQVVFPTQGQKNSPFGHQEAQFDR